MNGNDLQKLEIEIRQSRSDLESRCREIERQVEIAAAVEKERREKLEDTLTRIFAHLAKHDDVINRIVWLVFGAIISAFIAFTLTGGLQNAV